HPDPSICRVGEDYYLACSSFEYFPGVPVFHSRDLVNWRQIGNALDRPEQLPLTSETPSSAGVYAPTLRHHDGRFWLITTSIGGGGNILVTTTDPAGPWSDPVRLAGVPAIDPDLAWDEDGVCYCTYAGVGQVRIDPVAGKVLDQPRRIWSGSGKAPEAPHLFHIGEYWYLMIAEGGTERGHGVSIARGPAPDGPFEPCPANPILTHRGLDHPIQNTGHADLVQAVDGSWWMVLLGVRPTGGTPGWHVLGRETFLAPVAWNDEGWPVVGELSVEQPVPPWPLRPVAPVPVREEFEANDLAPHWISIRARPAGDCTTKERPGWLTLRARGASLDEPDVTFLGRRQQHLFCEARALLETADGRGGLAVRLDEEHHYEIEAGGGRVRVFARLGTVRTRVAEVPQPASAVTLAVRVTETREPGGPRVGPDTIAFGLADADGAFTELAALSGRYLSTEVAGGFTGRVIGVYAATGTVHVDWFDYRPLPQAP
ncbi:MAG TPA: glycoside hydrolase family 43 protein, partial [Actinospica sp.]|nr:glycoside hydrolase family 43 protein [Actinospica sp.]